MLEIFLGFLVLVYILDIAALFYFGIHCYAMLYLFLKNKQNCTTQPTQLAALRKKMGKWPKVTIQLPMYNEFYVAERVLDAACALDYPKNKLEIQVLDDSTDETQWIVQKKVQEYRKKGFNIRYIHRTNRKGHKAGALKEALDVAQGDFIAIFDADFIPAQDFLKKTIPYFWESPKIGMVQTRWGHINDNYSLLTKAQSIGIDGHFIIEQVARAGSKLWMNFNGTAGIWRKECIYDSGNWQYDTLTEDFDLSYRAELKGWEFKYFTDVVNPAELPATISAYKSQQFRWCKGSIQTAVKLIPHILRSTEPLSIKIEAITHLLNYTVHPLMIINILTTLPLLYFHHHFKSFFLPLVFATAFILSIGTLGPISMYIVSQIALYKNWRHRLLWLPMLTILGTGIALNNTKAWLEAIWGKKSQFIRTPKMKLEHVWDKISERSKYLHPKIDKIAFLEFCFALYLFFTVIIAFEVGKLFVVPFLMLYGIGFLYVSIMTLYEPIKQSLNQQRTVTEEKKVV